MDTDPQTLHARLDRLNRSLSRYAALRAQAQQHELSAWERYFLAQEQQLSVKINRLSQQLVTALPAAPERRATSSPSERLRDIIRHAEPVTAGERGVGDPWPPLRLENPAASRTAWRSA